MAARKPKSKIKELKPELSGTELRLELLSLARQIVEPADSLTEDEHGELVDRWCDLCPHPGGSDIIFWPNELGLCARNELSTFQMTPEAMAEFAMNWQPRVVAMRIAQRGGSERTGYFLYNLEAPDTPKTQVATPLSVEYQKGDVVAVALRGMMLKDGTRVNTEYPFKVHSCGRILGPTSEVVGGRIANHPAVIEYE